MSRMNAQSRTPMIAAAFALTLMSNAGLAQNTAPPQTADPVIREQPQVDIIMPQRPIRDGHIAQVSAVAVDVRLTDTLATTTMRVSVTNQGSRVSQARLLLPVPAGSTISTFGIDGIGDEPTAQLLPRAEASKRYHEIVRSMTDPGLLEFVGSALIQSSVFPVQPGESRTMTIVYEQSLDAHKGRIEYVLPRSASLSDSSINWSLDIELESTGPMGPVFSPSHPIVSKIVNDHAMRVGVPMMTEPGPFRLYAVLASPDEATCLLYPGADGPDSGYFMFVADTPPLDLGTDPIKREITIVIDRSGSMGGEKIRQARESARQIIAGMRDGELVHVIDYAADVRSFSDAPVEISDTTRAQLAAYIDQIRARGGTNLHDALIESLRDTGHENTLPMVLFLTDGQPTVGIRDESQIRADAKARNDAHKRVFTFGVGLDVNAPLLDGLAIDTKAESTFVLPGEDVELKVGQVFDKLDGPVMVNPVFEWAYADSHGAQPKLFMVEPGSLGDLFAGSRVVILGRYEGLADAPAHMWVSAPGNDQKLEADFSVSEASTKHAFVARLWAQQRINSLINEIRLAGADGTTPDQELVDEIVRLSLEHGIMSEYTAFLADESMSMEMAAAPEARRDARRGLDDANQQRTGSGGVSQSMNRQNQDAVALKSTVTRMESEDADYAYTGGRVETTGTISSNSYYDRNMRQVRVQTVQRGQGGTLYRKNNRWVDAQLGEQADQEPQTTIEFDTEPYWALVEDLTAQGRQWILANRGEIYFMNHDQRVLVKNPS